MTQVDMRKILTFHGILFHVQPIRALAETGTLEFFENNESNSSESVVDVHEGVIVRWLLGQPAVRSLLYSHAHLDPKNTDHLGVGRPVIEKAHAKPGDVDWLCIGQCQPYSAVAFECKRVKVKAVGPGDDHINKIEDLGRGVAQASGLADMGFHRAFLMIIIQADGRRRQDLGQVFRGPTEQTFKRIYDFPQRESLNEDVGVVFVKVVQPTGRAHGEMAYVGVCIDKMAKPRDQSSSLTARLREYLRSPG